MKVSLVLKSFSMQEELLKGKTLLVVDDEVDLRDIMASEMEFIGSKAFQAGNISIAKDILEKNHVDLIISDIRMPGGTGIDLLEYVKGKNPSTPPVILITGFADITVEDAFNKGAEALINKPFKLDDLIKDVARHSLPVEKRFVNPGTQSTQEVRVDFKSTVSETIKARDFLVGRGGMTLYLNTQRKKIDVGETIYFEVTFADEKLTGAAVCRWHKVHESGLKVAAGFEFEDLPEKTLEFFTTYWKNNSLVCYIPIH